MEEEELMSCAWCQSKLVPVNEGFCSQKCYDDNKKANEE